MIIDWFAPAVVIALGLVFGSFANVVIYRFPRGESLSHPGSRCPSCQTPIRWFDNVPVLSWVVLRARCRGCGEPISARYPAVELASGALWLLAWGLWGVSARTVCAIAFFYLLLILAAIDLDTFRLPNALVALTGAVGVVGVAYAELWGVEAVPLVDPVLPGWGPLASAGAGVVLGGGLPMLVGVLYMAVRGANGLGMGDIKLLAVMGLFLGPYVVLGLLLGSLLGVAGSVGSGVGPWRHRKIPFGPYLAAGAVLTAAVGPDLLGWYLSLL